MLAVVDLLIKGLGASGKKRVHPYRTNSSMRPSSTQQLRGQWVLPGTHVQSISNKISASSHHASSGCWNVGWPSSGTSSRAFYFLSIIITIYPGLWTGQVKLAGRVGSCDSTRKNPLLVRSYPPDRWDFKSLRPDPTWPVRESLSTSSSCWHDPPPRPVRLRMTFKMQVLSRVGSPFWSARTLLIVPFVFFAPSSRFFYPSTDVT